jgi:hypothetical protein
MIRTGVKDQGSNLHFLHSFTFLYFVHSVLCTFRTLYIPYFVHSVLCTLHIALCTLYFVYRTLYHHLLSL